MFQNDEDLVKRCRENDEAAWEEIVFKYQNLLFSIPRRAGLGKDLASDVLQDVFTTLFEKLDLLEKPEFLRAWLISTTRFKTMHLIQREIRGKTVSIDESDEDDFAYQVQDPTLPVDDVLVKLERDAQIESAFGLIEDRCRKLLTMLYVEKELVSYNEIAEKLNIPLGSIGPTKARCLEKLIKNLPNH